MAFSRAAPLVVSEEVLVLADKASPQVASMVVLELA